MEFVDRHVGMDEEDRRTALRAIGVENAEELIASAIPQSIRLGRELNLPQARSEEEVAYRLRELAGKNSLVVPMYGTGYWATQTPAVIRRNVLENPAWYTAYTPYQPEISQGRLEMLMVFQTMVSDLMGLPSANASLLDEATAGAEAVALARRTVKKGHCAILDSRLLPATIDVVRTRAEAMGIEIHVAADMKAAISEHDPFCVVVAQLGVEGHLRTARECRELTQQAHDRGALVVAASDLLAATLITPPGSWGADVAVGSAQRFGIPLWYGGPAAGFMAVRSGLERQMPGRLVGLSKDADGVDAYRLALQTREQHIRREKATSNICTAQVLLAVAAGFYAVWHGPEGLRAIAETIHGQASRFADAARRAGYSLVSEYFFDTVAIRTPRADELAEAARQKGIGIGHLDGDTVIVAFGEGIGEDTMAGLAEVFSLNLGAAPTHLGDHSRPQDFLTAPVFSAHRSETSIMRYMRALADRDYGLDRGMIPLGSCTMKLNPAVAMEAISLPGFTEIHPYAPGPDTAGYQEMMGELGDWLAEITGYDAVSFQPNAGSQGEFAGLMAIRRYHLANGEPGRTVCLIPTSAHGTNAASAVMAGLSVVPVRVGDDGSIDIEDLRAKVGQYAPQLAGIMVTYPSTHGVYEASIREVCDIVHEAGGQVYVDGANFNAMAGLARLGDLGADASHLNLHKTFAIPHGGGGPGVGPIAVKAHLAGFLPGHELLSDATGAVSGAPYGSAGILPITYAYVAMMGADGLRQATTDAIIAANYVSVRLADAFPTLYTGQNFRVAHECILDLRPLTHETGITVDDVAKRLIDYGFHAPTMSFPVAGTLMVEPTESESLAELDRFCEAMIAIRAEIDLVATGQWGEDNPLRNAPHPAHRLVSTWEHPYSREQALYPSGIHPGPLLATGRDKYWPPVARIDQAYGDRHLVLRLDEGS